MLFQTSYSQDAIITGLILNEQNFPIKDVNIQYGDNGTISDVNGYYSLSVNSSQKTEITARDGSSPMVGAFRRALQEAARN